MPQPSSSAQNSHYLGTSEDNLSVESGEFGPLARLNYFDGLFLRSSHLRSEQDYFRNLARFGALAGGKGVVHGFELERAPGGGLRVRPGLAFDGRGRALLQRTTATLSLSTLLDARAAPGTSATGVALPDEFGKCEPGLEDTPPGPASGLYRVCIGHDERLCGHEDVMGALCDNACVQDAERAYRVEGVRLWLEPISLGVATSKAVGLTELHERSLFASAYFVQDRLRKGHLISGPGLASPAWCAGAEATEGDCVALGLLSVRGEAIGFLDAWSARRERIEMQPKRHWALQLRMRPYALFLAEVLQFQCQLSEILRDELDGDGGYEDPCAPALAKVKAVSASMEAARKMIAEAAAGAGLDIEGRLAELDKLQAELAGLEGPGKPSGRRRLIDGGIVELPPTGYLPVEPGSALTVNEQVRRWMGEGVDLRFCRVSHDYVQHAFEEAQHMDRISLLQGLDDPLRKPPVDVLVPDGELIPGQLDAAGTAFVGRAFLGLGYGDDPAVSLSMSSEEIMARAKRGLAAHGGGRAVKNPSGGYRLAYAAAATDRVKKVQARLPEEAYLLERHGQPSRREMLDDLARGMAMLRGALRGGRAGGEPVEEPPPAPAPEVLPQPGPEPAPEPEAVRELYGIRRRHHRAGERMLESIEAMGPQIAERAQGALLADVTLDNDPLAQSAGGRSVASARVALLLPSRKNLAQDLSITAEVTYDNVSNAGSRTMFSGSMRANGTLRAIAESGGVSVEDSSFLEELTFAGFADSATGTVKVKLQLPVADGVVVFSAYADFSSGDKVIVRVLVRSKGIDEGAPSYVFDSELALEDRALDEGQPMRAVAAQAIDLIDSALGDEGLVTSARSFLFGRVPEQGTADLVMRATRDWVLFHRRRDKTCSGALPPPPARPDRRYQVYHVPRPPRRGLVAERGSLMAMQPYLGAADVTNLLEDATPLGIASFSDGSPELTSSAAALAADLAAAGAGPELLVSVIASQGDADSEILERQRLTAIANAVQATSQRTPTTREYWLPDLPAPAVTASADGMVLLMTAPGTECLQVRITDVNGQIKEHVMADLPGPAAGPVIAGYTKPLGGLNFSRGTAQLDSAFEDGGAEVPRAELARQVAENLGNGQVPYEVRLFAAGPQTEAAVERAKVAVEALGLTRNNSWRQPVFGQAGLPEPCPLVLVIVRLRG